MPPRSMLAMKQQQQQAPQNAYDYSGRRLKLVAAQKQAMSMEEPSPMMEAIRKYLDSLP